MRGVWRTALLACIGGLSISCGDDEEPEDPFQESRDVLTANDWAVSDLRVSINQRTLPPPALAGAVDEEGFLVLGLVDAGLIFRLGPDTSELRETRLRFQPDGTIEEKEPGSDSFEYLLSRYRIPELNQVSIRYRFGNFIKYDFVQDTSELLQLSVNPDALDTWINLLNGVIERAIKKGTPDRLADSVSEILFTNPAVGDAINAFLSDAIRDRLEPIADLEPSVVAEQVAAVVIAQVDAIGLATILEAALTPVLERITGLDPTTVAPALAADLEALLQARVTEEGLAAFLLPYVEAFTEVDTARVGELVFLFLQEATSPENLQPRFQARLEQLVQLTPEEVTPIAATLAGVVESVWINVDTLSGLFEPTLNQLDATPVIQIPSLTNEIVTNIQATVDAINLAFPDLMLAPNYDVISTAVNAFLVAAKPSVTADGPDVVADNLATTLINTFLTTEFLTDSFVTAINALQVAVDPVAASDTLSLWVAALVGRAEQTVIDSVSSGLASLLAGIDPTTVATDLALLTRGAIFDVVNAESLTVLLLPVLESLTEVDVAVAADRLAAILVDSGVIEETVSEEDIATALTPIVEELLTADLDQLAETLAARVLELDALSTLITEERVSNIISFALYKRAIARLQIRDTVDAIEIDLARVAR